MVKKITTIKRSSQKTKLLKRKKARKQSKEQTKNDLISEEIVERDVQEEHPEIESTPKRSLYAAYLEKLKIQQIKEFLNISKETVMVELQKRKDAKINNTLHGLSDARGELFYHQAKDLTN